MGADVRRKPDTCAEDLRAMATSLRRHPTPLADMIPLMIAAADRIESLKEEVNQAASCSVYEIPGHPQWGPA